MGEIVQGRKVSTVRLWRRRTLLWLRVHRTLVRRGLIGLAALTLLSIIFQIAYPASSVLPFVRVEDKRVGARSISAAAASIEKRYDGAIVAIKAGDKSFTQTLTEIGIDSDGLRTAQAAAQYPFFERLIPFSSVFIMAHRNTPLQINIDDERLHYFAQQIEKSAFVPAVNAMIAVKDGVVTLVPSKQSRSYAASNTERILRATHFMPKTQVSLPVELRPADRTDDEVKGVLSEAQKAVDTPLTLDLNNQKISVTKPTIGSWLDFVEDPSTKALQLALKQDTVTAYLNSIQSKIYKAPGVTHVQLVDGREVSRTVGATGQGIDIAKTMTMLTATIKQGSAATIQVPIAQLPPQIVYDRQYSDSGLSELLGDLADAKGYGIAVIDPTGTHTGNANGAKQFEAASTYKLFVAYAVFKRIEAGQMQWSDVVSNGRTADVCFDAMIVNSDNTCATAFANIISWQTIQSLAVSLGATGTSLTDTTKLTTANDLASYLLKLQNGTLLSADETTKLVNDMKRQIYRSGIPAGTGRVVADKVGFVDNVIHDAGIVYGAKGPYIMVVMTANGSWDDIANAARQIDAFMGR